MTHCIDCDRPVVWADVLATPEGAKVAMIADSFGVEPLSERRQAIYHGWVCAECLTPTTVGATVPAPAMFEFLTLDDEEFEAGLGAQIDAWRDAGASWDEIVPMSKRLR